MQSVRRSHFSNAAGASVPNAGATGAIAGVLGAYLVLLPNAKVLVFIFFLIREIPAVWFLGIWFLFQFVEGGFATAPPAGGRRRRLLRTRRRVPLRSGHGPGGRPAPAVTTELVSASLLTGIVIAAGAVGLVVVLLWFFSGD